MNSYFLRNISIFFAFILVFSLPVPALDLAGKADQTFRNWDKETSPGLAIAIVKDGEIIFKKGYGMASLNYGIPNTASTLFRFGSNSKQFTVLSILLLEEEGLLSTEDEVQDYIPEFPDFGRSITLQHLIDHTSGLRDYLELMAFGGWNLLDDLITINQGLDIVKRMRELNFDPGSQFMYSNTGFLLLAETVKRVSGKTFAEFTQERIFTPLGMTNTHFADNHRIINKNFASSYSGIYEGEYYRQPVNFASVGEGGLISTVEDIAKWDQNFYDATVGSQAILTKMHKKGRLNDGSLSPMSAGLIVTEYNGKRLVYHGGDIGGYHAQIARFPNNKFTIITASNTFELMSDQLMAFTIEIADFYFANPGSTPVSDFMIHEPSMRGWGTGEPLFYAPDLDLVFNLNDKSKKLQDRITGISQPMITREQAEEFEGLFYSDELDSFFTLTYDDEANLLFRLPRSPRPYWLSARNIRRDNVYFNETDGIDAVFFRNGQNEVIGFKLSNPRVVDLEFKKAEIVTKE